jgi:RNA polymerase sigma factor (sigma-70 family)
LSTVVDTRPTRAEIEPAALDVIRRRGAEILATARRYAATEHDAEDAYQRGLEILLTKAPSTCEDDLVPWLKTVVKHEAFALRKQRERHGVPTERDELAPAHADTHEQVERLDRLQRGAEALQRLKPAEMRCLVLLAQGHSYAEICAITGFTYTKVNRCLAEGRQSFVNRIDRIESGAECERLAPVVSAAADGEAGAEDMLMLKRHLRGCLACRKALREARSVPARVAALAPAGVLGVPQGGPVHGVFAWLHERVSSLVLRGQEFAEAAAAHKTVAIAASAAALAGGGVATVKTVTDHHPAKPAVKRAAQPAAKPTSIPARPAPKARTAPRTTRPAPEPAPARVSPRPAASHEATSPALPAPQPAATSKPAAADGVGGGEFGP